MCAPLVAFYIASLPFHFFRGRSLSQFFPCVTSEPRGLRTKSMPAPITTGRAAAARADGIPAAHVKRDLGQLNSHVAPRSGSPVFATITVGWRVRSVVDPLRRLAFDPLAATKRNYMDRVLLARSQGKR